jgi:hypothetical protein
MACEKNCTLQTKPFNYITYSEYWITLQHIHLITSTSWTRELPSDHSSNFLHTVEHLEWILQFHPFVRVTPLGVLVVPQGVEQQGVLRVDEVLQRAHRDAILLPAGEQHREPLAVAARRPHAVEARRHWPVRGDRTTDTQQLSRGIIAMAPSEKCGSRSYPELLAGHDGEGAGRYGDVHLQAFHLALHDHADHGVVVVLEHGHAGLRVQRRVVVGQPNDVGQQAEVAADALSPDAETLQDQRLHHPLQLQQILGERHDRLTGHSRTSRGFSSSTSLHVLALFSTACGRRAATASGSWCCSPAGRRTASRAGGPRRRGAPLALQPLEA